MRIQKAVNSNFELTSDFDNENKVQTLTIHGKIYMGDGDVQIRREVDKLSDDSNPNKPKAVIFDLANCEYMCSGSLGEVIRSFSTTKRAGIEMVLTGVRHNIKDLMTATKLETIFDFYQTPEEAKSALLK